MNIAIFTDSFTPLINGITISTINLAKGLANKGHKVYILAPGYKKLKEFSYKNVKVKRIFSIPAFFYPGFKFTPPITPKIIKYLKENKIDIIHFQTTSTIGLQAILISKILKKPLIGTFHTFITDAQYLKHAHFDVKFIQDLTWKFVRAYYNQCDLVTCPSKSTKKELIKNNITKPIKVISNGIDLSSFKTSNLQKFIKKYKLNNKTVLFVGRVAYEKNIDYLLDCFKLVVQKVPDSKLLIVGDGPQMREFKDLIKKLKISRNVVFAGKIEYKNLLKSGIFKLGKIFATASITENQPMTLLEAQANGIVCVGINTRGIKDLIRNNYNGYLVKEDDKEEFADKIIKLLKNKNTYDRMKENTLKEIKKHDLKKIIREWERTYKNLIKSN